MKLFISDTTSYFRKILAQGDPSTTRHAVTIIAKMFQTESLHVMRDVYIFFTVHVATFVDHQGMHPSSNDISIFQRASKFKYSANKCFD
jgi:hypothetical protein